MVPCPPSPVLGFDSRWRDGSVTHCPAYGQSEPSACLTCVGSGQLCLYLLLLACVQWLNIMAEQHTPPLHEQCKHKGKKTTSANPELAALSTGLQLNQSWQSPHWTTGWYIHTYQGVDKLDNAHSTGLVLPSLQACPGEPIT